MKDDGEFEEGLKSVEKNKKGVESLRMADQIVVEKSDGVIVRN